MKPWSKTTFAGQWALVVSGIPLFIWAMGGTHARHPLQEILSILAILILCQMMVLCFWSRAHAWTIKTFPPRTMIRWHKRIGYVCVGIMLFHPLMPVASKFLEPGMAPTDAFITLVTTFNRGVLLGIAAWCTMVVLGVTALTRSHLPMRYTTWRIFHATLAILFIVLAVWHALDLGRHATLSMALYIILLAAGAILPVAMHYLK
jgi:predicted ferric reductase